jgi:hypothetical protein
MFDQVLIFNDPEFGEQRTVFSVPYKNQQPE